MWEGAYCVAGALRPPVLVSTDNMASKKVVDNVHGAIQLFSHELMSC
jgi:hypothetical protein